MSARLRFGYRVWSLGPKWYCEVVTANRGRREPTETIIVERSFTSEEAARSWGEEQSRAFQESYDRKRAREKARREAEVIYPAEHAQTEEEA